MFVQGCSTWKSCVPQYVCVTKTWTPHSYQSVVFNKAPRFQPHEWESNMMEHEYPHANHFLPSNNYMHDESIKSVCARLRHLHIHECLGVYNSQKHGNHMDYTQLVGSCL